MPKTASKKPITADKLGLAESMVDAGKKRRGRPKKLKSLEEVKADIDKRNPTYVSPLTGGRLPGKAPKEKKDDSLKKFQDALKFLTERVTNNEKKITKLKNIIKLRRENDKLMSEDVKPPVDVNDMKDTGKDDVINFLTNVFQPSIVKIEESLNKILGNFEEQIDADKEKQDQLRVDEDQASDKAREDKLEKPKEKGMIQTGIEKAIKPVQGFMDQILNFFKNIILGGALLKLIDILENPEQIMKPLTDFANGVIDFGNSFIKAINRYLLGPINFVVQGLMNGLQALLDPIDFIKGLFGLEVDLPLDEFKAENLQPLEIKEIPRIEPKAEMQGGGQVPAKQMQSGGEVPGQGTGDTVPAMLEPGEFVMSRGAVDQIGVGELEEMNAAGGGTNKPIIKEGTSYAKGGGSIGIKGSGNTGQMQMKDKDGKKVGETYDVVSGAPGTEGISQEMRKSVPGKGFPMPNGTYKVHSFDEHGPLSKALSGLGNWSAYIGSGDGNIGKRSGMMIHSDIDPYGTLGCIGVALGGKPGTQKEKTFLKSWSMANPETISVDFSAPSGEGSGSNLRSETSDNSMAKMSSSKSGMTTPPGTPNGGGSKIMAMSGGKSGNSGGLTSSSGGNAKGAERFSSSDSRNDSNIIVQSIYNLVG